MGESALRTYDITVAVHPGVVMWPGEEPPRVRSVIHLDRGDDATLTRIDMTTHTASHLDAPAHFIRGGLTVDQLAPDLLCGPCAVLDLTDVASGHVGEAHLMAKRALLDVPRILLKTRNGARMRGAAYDAGYCALDLPAARLLVAAGARAVGVDYLSVDRDGDLGFPVHRELLGHGVVAIESLCLADVPEGRYELLCLPMLIRGAEGAPVRAVLREIARA